MSSKKMHNLILMMLDDLGEVPTIKLAKLLYYADFLHYKKTGKPITNSTYLHLEHGPCAAAFQATLHELTASHKVGFKTKTYSGEMTSTYRAYTTNTHPDKAVFSKSELQTINDVIKRYGGLSGEKLREMTHNEFPWKTTKPYEKIPFSLAQYIDNPVDSDTEAEDAFFKKSVKLERIVSAIKDVSIKS